MLKPKMLALLFCSLLLGSCTSIYFERPVPQSGVDLLQTPSEWVGAYQVFEDEPTENTSLWTTFFRFDQMDAQRMMISSEDRIHASALPKLAQQLASDKKEGILVDYFMSSHCIYTTALGPEGQLLQNIAHLQQDGDWYVLARSYEPMFILNTKDRILTKFDLQKNEFSQSSTIPASDSVTSENLPMIFRKKGKNWYLNTIFTSDNNKYWSLIAFKGITPDSMDVVLPSLKNEQDFKTNLDKYNKITPFKAIGEEASSDFLINPDDKALEQLLNAPDLFQVLHLKKWSTAK
jgi:hypothetical protein